LDKVLYNIYRGKNARRI